MPSPYATGVPNSQAGVIISPAHLYYDFVRVSEFSSRLTTFQVGGAGDRTADSWVTSQTLPHYTTGDFLSLTVISDTGNFACSKEDASEP